MSRVSAVSSSPCAGIEGSGTGGCPEAAKTSLSLIALLRVAYSAFGRSAAAFTRSRPERAALDQLHQQRCFFVRVPRRVEQLGNSGSHCISRAAWPQDDLAAAVQPERRLLVRRDALESCCASLVAALQAAQHAQLWCPSPGARQQRRPLLSSIHTMSKQRVSLPSLPPAVYFLRLSCPSRGIVLKAFLAHRD